MAQVIGPALSTPYATGYSTLGALVPKLSASAIIKKDQLAIKRQEERERLARSSEFTRWWHDSSSRRVTKALLDAVNPFDNNARGLESLV